MSRKLLKYHQVHRTKFGFIAESFVAKALSRYGDVIHQKYHHYDLVFNGLKIEVKAAQLGSIRSGFNVRRVNHGWTVEKSRHEKLLEDGGFYALALMIDEEIICIRFIPAEKLLNHRMYCQDTAVKPRIRFGTLYAAMKLSDFICTFGKFDKPKAI